MWSGTGTLSYRTTLRVERRNPTTQFSTSEFTKQNRKQPKQEFDEDEKHSGWIINMQGWGIRGWVYFGVDWHKDHLCWALRVHSPDPQWYRSACGNRMSIPVLHSQTHLSHFWSFTFSSYGFIKYLPGLQQNSVCARICVGRSVTMLHFALLPNDLTPLLLFIPEKSKP